MNVWELITHPKLAELVKLLPLDKLKRLKPLLARDKLEDFSDADFDLLGEVLEVRWNVTAELKTAARAFLRSTHLDTVSDMLNQPESLAQLIDMFKNGVTPYVQVGLDSANAVKRRGIWDCENCGLANLTELSGDEEFLECSECGAHNPIPEGIFA